MNQECTAKSAFNPYRPYWPFASEEDKKKDERAKLPNPVVDDGGLWYLGADDIECLRIGCGIMGSGGGGDPNKGARLAMNLWKQGKQLKIYNPLFGVDSHSAASDMKFCTVGLIGVPGPQARLRDISGPCTTYALKAVQWAVASGVCLPDCGGGKVGNVDVKVLEREFRDGTKIYLADPADLEKVAMTSDEDILQRDRIVGLVASETGGINSFAPLRVVTGEKELTYLDAGGVGRSVPELQMYLPFIYGVKPYPSAIASNTGEIFLCTYIESAEKLEKFFRDKSQELQGSIGGMAFGVMSYQDIEEKCVVHATSHAWQLGRAVVRARRMGTSPVQAVLRQRRGGVVIITGEVTDIKRKSQAGFSYSIITISGRDSYIGYTVVVEAQNEIYVARNLDITTMYACTPDIITMVIPQTGDPITSSDEHLLCKTVSLLGFLSSPLMKTPKAMEVVGPKAFNLPFPYHPPKSVLTGSRWAPTQYEISKL